MSKENGASVPIRSIGIFLVTWAMFLPSLGNGAEISQSGQKRIPFEGIKHVQITNPRGEIKVRGSQDIGEIVCNYTLNARGPKGKKLEEALSTLKVSMEAKGDTVFIAGIYPERIENIEGLFSIFWKARFGTSIDMDISLPKRVTLSVTTASADVAVSAVSGAVEIATASGDTYLRDIVSKVKLRASSGDVSVEDIGADVDIATSSGDIRLRNVAGDASVQSSSGDISIAGLQGALVVRTSSGDLAVEKAGSVIWSSTSGDAVFSGIRGSFKASSSTGDIELIVSPVAPADFKIATSSGSARVRFSKPIPGGFKFSARTSSGSIRARLPLEISEVSRNVLSGIVGEGKSSFSVETSSGDISVAYPEE